MNANDFCFWLRGYFEGGGDRDGMTREELDAVKERLDSVVEHENGMLPASQPKTPAGKPGAIDDGVELLIPSGSN